MFTSCPLAIQVFRILFYSCLQEWVWSRSDQSEHWIFLTIGTGSEMGPWTNHLDQWDSIQGLLWNVAKRVSFWWTWKCEMCAWNCQRLHVQRTLPEDITNEKQRWRERWSGREWRRMREREREKRAARRVRTREGGKRGERPLDPATPDLLLDFSVMRASKSFFGLSLLLSLATTRTLNNMLPF